MFFSQSGFNVKSYGAGNCIKLPGPSVDRPNVYEFGKVTYAEILADLTEKDFKMYQQTGIINMLERNVTVKERPEKFQCCTDPFDVIFSCEVTVFDKILQGNKYHSFTTPV